MARDLIPPPSPAGRPSPDAMRNLGAPEPAAEAPGATDAHSAAPPGPTPYRSRFGFVAGALAGVAVAAAVAAVALLGSDPANRGAGSLQLADNWSTYKPSGEDVPGAIATHVQGEYELAKGKQLVNVETHPFYIYNGTSIIPFAIKLQLADGTIRTLGAEGVFYQLTGTGEGGKIVGGKPSPERHRLLRREALELSLYSFRYVDGITMAVTILPPTDPVASAKAELAAAKGAKAKAKAKADVEKAATAKPELQAIFYRPGDLRKQLQTPLTRTLQAGRFSPETLPKPEIKRVDGLTSDNLFKADFQTLADGRLYLVLDRSEVSKAK